MTPARLLLALLCLIGSSSCGSSPSSPTPTPTPTPQANRAPVLTSVTASPTFGIQNLHTFTFAAAATDADGDALSYTWFIAGVEVGNTAAISGTFTFGGSGIAVVTVSDGRGGSASSSVDFVVGSMTGNWTVTSGPLVGATFTLTQNSVGIVTGTFSLPGIGNGNTDPAQPGTINTAATLSMRVKIGAFTDFTMNGTMSNSGRLVTGTLQGSGFNGQPFAMSK